MSTPPRPTLATSKYPGANPAYPSGYAGAAAAEIPVAPFITIVVLTVLLGSERIPARREQLRRWRFFAAVWLAVWLLLFVLAVAFIGGATAVHVRQVSGVPRP